MNPNLAPKSDLGGTSTTHFHPWVAKVAQVVPNGAQSGPKGPQRLLKCSENAAQGLQNVDPKIADKREAATKA